MIDYNTYLPSKAIMVEFFETMQYAHCLSSDVTILPLCNGQALTANTIGLRMVLFGAASLEQVIPSLVCNRMAPCLILDSSVSR